jgi:hypothetical protein
MLLSPFTTSLLSTSADTPDVFESSASNVAGRANPAEIRSKSLLFISCNK